MNNLPEEMMQNLKRRGKKSGFVMLLTSKAWKHNNHRNIAHKAQVQWLLLGYHLWQERVI